jgi:hypothetical protein
MSGPTSLRPGWGCSWSTVGFPAGPSVWMIVAGESSLRRASGCRALFQVGQATAGRFALYARPVFGVSSQRREMCAVNIAVVVSLVLAILAVLGVFIEIPFVSDFAFWVAVGAYIILAGSYRRL